MVTVLSSIFALVIAVPIAIGIATFLTNYAPRRVAKTRSPRWSTCLPRLRQSSSACGDLRARPWLAPVARFLNDNLGWFFLFADAMFR